MTARGVRPSPPKLWRRVPAAVPSTTGGLLARDVVPRVLYLAVLAVMSSRQVIGWVFRLSGASAWWTQAVSASALVGVLTGIFLALQRPADGHLGRRLVRAPLAVAVCSGVVFVASTAIRFVPAWWLVVPFAVALLNFGPGYLLPQRPKEVVNDPRVAERVRRICGEAGIPIATIGVEEGGFTDRHDAVFSGLGAARSVVTVARRMLERPAEQLDVVIAHEIGHIRRHHAPTVIASWWGSLLVTFLAVRFVSATRVMRLWTGAQTAHDPRAVPAVILCAIVTGGVMFLCAAWFRRMTERQADIDALEFTRDADAFEAYAATLEEPATLWKRAWSEYPTPSERRALAAWWRTTNVLSVLFTDIQDSTRLLEKLGDRAWFERLQDHNRLLRDTVTEHGGREVDSAGDGFLFVFPDAGQAVLCARELQRLLVASSSDDPIRVRMGIHTGTVMRQGESVYGREVHLAARIANAAAGGEIFVSSVVERLLAHTNRFSFEDRGEHSLKGFTGTHQIYAVDWEAGR